MAVDLLPDAQAERGRGGGLRPSEEPGLHRAQGLSGHPDAAGAHHAVKVLLFFDVGGSMDWHVKATEEAVLGGARRVQDMEHFYFHNCLYEKVWKEKPPPFRRHHADLDVLHTYPHDYKAIFVGDCVDVAYEIMRRAASVEHYNEETARLDWARRAHVPACVWLNPVAEKMGISPVDPHAAPARERAGCPLTLEGLDQAMRDWCGSLKFAQRARSALAVAGSPAGLRDCRSARGHAVKWREIASR